MCAWVLTTDRNLHCARWGSSTVMYTWGSSFEAVMAANHKHTFNLTHPLVHIYTHTICTVIHGVPGSPPNSCRLHSRLSFPPSVLSKHPQIVRLQRLTQHLSSRLNPFSTFLILLNKTGHWKLLESINCCYFDATFRWDVVHSQTWVDNRTDKICTKLL